MTTQVCNSLDGVQNSFNDENNKSAVIPCPLTEMEIVETSKSLSDETRVASCFRCIFSKQNSSYLSSPVIWREIPDLGDLQDPAGILYPHVLIKVCLLVKNPDFIRSISHGLVRMVPDHKVQQLWRETVIVLFATLSVLMQKDKIV